MDQPDPTDHDTAAASIVPATDSADHTAADSADGADSADSAGVGPLPGVARHPVLACVDAVRSALKDTAGVDPVFMTTPEKAEALLALAGLVD
ncbi:MAG TPA: hypothetical protein VGJ41_12745, partial [Nocardioides sp.]